MRIVYFLLLFVLIASAFAFFGQRKLIFPAPSDSLPANLDPDIEIIALAEGRALLAPSLKSNISSPLIIFAHGNAEVAHWSIDWFRYLREMGFAVLLLEYPGYGGTNGSPSANSIQTASLMALNAVRVRQDIDDTRIIIYGRSIGSGVACRLAADTKVAALILESPFISLKSLVSEKGFPTFMLRDHFDNAGVVSALNIPIFLYHGSEDQVIPIHHSQKLADLAENVVFHKARCGHNDCPRPWPELTAFFKSNGLLP